MGKNPPAMRKTWVRSLDWEDPLEEGMATHSSVLAWRIPVDRGAWRAAVHSVAELQYRRYVGVWAPISANVVDENVRECVERRGDI